MALSETTSREAIAWLIRQRDPAFAEWEELTAWLEADPAHAQTYHELTLVDAGVADRLSGLSCVAAHGSRSDGHSRRRTRMGNRRWLPLSRRAAVGGGTAIAATLAAAMLIPSWTMSRSLYTIRTAAGVQQEIRLEPGTTVALNGGTILQLDKNDPRFASLREGEAFFSVRHDEDRQFVVELPDATLVDLGTQFNVVREGRATELAVAEGAVEFRGGGQSVRVDAGEQLVDSPDLLRVAKGDPETIGSWRNRKLIYRGAPLSAVARDLSRLIGVKVIADRSVATRPVTAVVQVPQNRNELAGRLERLLDIRVKRSEDHWTLTQR